MTSPTFTIVQEYDGRVPVAHVDVYRLDRIQELHDLGFEELLDGAGVTLVEWGDAVARVLPPDRLVVRIDARHRRRRRAPSTIEAHGPSWRTRARAALRRARRSVATELG